MFQSLANFKKPTIRKEKRQSPEGLVPGTEGFISFLFGERDKDIKEIKNSSKSKAIIRNEDVEYPNFHPKFKTSIKIDYMIDKGISFLNAIDAPENDYDFYNMYGDELMDKANAVFCLAIPKKQMGPIQEFLSKVNYLTDFSYIFKEGDPSENIKDAYDKLLDSHYLEFKQDKENRMIYEKHKLPNLTLIKLSEYVEEWGYNLDNYEGTGSWSMTTDQVIDSISSVYLDTLRIVLTEEDVYRLGQMLTIALDVSIWYTKVVHNVSYGFYKIVNEIARRENLPEDVAEADAILKKTNSKVTPPINWDKVPELCKDLGLKFSPK
jgi:hypothetical protein